MDCATDFPGRYHNIGMKLNLKDTHVFGLYVFLHSLSQCYQIFRYDMIFFRILISKQYNTQPY